MRPSGVRDSLSMATAGHFWHGNQGEACAANATIHG
jgi:hypothetical protein